MKDNVGIAFKVHTQPTIKTLSILCEMAAKGVTEIELVVALASLTLTPQMTVDELLELPADDYKTIRELTAPFQLIVKGALV